MISREFNESPTSQGVQEEIAYTLDTTPWGSSPTGVTLAVYDVTGGSRTDVSATVIPSGALAVVGNVITFPTLKNLLTEHAYRIECRFAIGGNVLAAWGIVRGEN